VILYLAVSTVILLASFLFAMLGLGGGMVYVPVLKWAGFPVKEVAIPLGLLLNGLNTLLALIPFARNRLVDWRGGLAMAAAASLLAPAGARMAQHVPVKALLLLFSAAVLVAAFRMALFARQSEPKAIMSLRKRSVIGGFAGGFAGFTGGMLGLGGGFIIAPILLWMGYRTKVAAATTAFVVTCSSFSGYLGHISEGPMSWPLTAALVGAILLGSQLGGTFMSKKAKPQWVKTLYAAVLLAIAVKLIVDAWRV
jgi:uncharacterized membrane protein YfcA